MQAMVRKLERFGHWAQGPAACFMLVVLLPGGSLLALLLLLYRQRDTSVREILARAVSTLRRPLLRPPTSALQPCYIRPPRIGRRAEGRR